MIICRRHPQYPASSLSMSLRGPVRYRFRLEMDHLGPLPDRSGPVLSHPFPLPDRPSSILDRSGSLPNRLSSRLNRLSSILNRSSSRLNRSSSRLNRSGPVLGRSFPVLDGPRPLRNHSYSGGNYRFLRFFRQKLRLFVKNSLFHDLPPTLHLVGEGVAAGDGIGRTLNWVNEGGCRLGSGWVAKRY